MVNFSKANSLQKSSELASACSTVIMDNAFGLSFVCNCSTLTEHKGDDSSVYLAFCQQSDRMQPVTLYLTKGLKMAPVREA